MKLSKRLQLILEQIPEGSRVADIGSDHALLPVAAVETGRAAFAIAGEVNPGPLKAASKQVAEAGMEQTISVRHGDGLEVVSPGEVNVVTIAGMGGGLIASILDQGEERLKGVTKLVLQPNVGEDLLRRWLLEHGWVLVSEMIMEEDRKIYEILTAEPENTENESLNRQLYEEQEWSLDSGPVLKITKDLLLRMGPWLIQQPSPVFYAKWESELVKLEGILKSVLSSTLESAELKAGEIRKEINQIQGVLSCLQKDKQ